MNRHQRRAAVSQLSPQEKAARAQALGDARRRERDAAAEATVAAKASKLTPAQARKALAEWAARGGK